MHYIPLCLYDCLIHCLCNCQNQPFLGALAKVRKAMISFVMSVCPSVRPHGAPHLTLGGFQLQLIFE